MPGSNGGFRVLCCQFPAVPQRHLRDLKSGLVVVYLWGDWFLQFSLCFFLVVSDAVFAVGGDFWWWFLLACVYWANVIRPSGRSQTIDPMKIVDSEQTT